MIQSCTGDIPGGYRKVLVDSAYTHGPAYTGLIDANWFALEALPGRVYGATVLLLLDEGGAVYRDLPLHALMHHPVGQFVEWTAEDAQTWDCYSHHFVTLVYDYLDGLRCKVRTARGDLYGHFWFAIKPCLDAFSADPAQAKTFFLIALDNGRFTLQPTNHILLEERSHTDLLGPPWPKGLKRSTEIVTCE
jgi:hypothetical protein